ncbi:HAD-like domain-containing protein [Lipomyces japonicus]|uniref:HAD-like domain-containing protein n=1 Tax=Lipomyces japonicus TaxID=56871 RepID=UPI0034CF957A
MTGISRSLAKKFAFAFDIDGVLIRGAKPLPAGIRALQLLQSNNIPWILLTNGGGKSEANRVADLERTLGMPISTQQFIQSHTPFRRLANAFDKVLVVGGQADTCRHVAREYGFANVAMSVDVVAAHPSAWPFHQFTTDQLAAAAPLTDEPFNAVLVFNDSRDWGCDTQVIIDILTSQAGVLGTKSKTLAQALPVYWSNNDLLWANEYPLPRFGQGAFRTAVERVFKDYTSQSLNSTIIGKPHLFTYEYAAEVLQRWRRAQFAYDDADLSELKRVYMVGDNPESDIRGANNFGWHSILVRSGVYQHGDRLDSGSTPKTVAQDAYDAVVRAIELEKSLA